MMRNKWWVADTCCSCLAAHKKRLFQLISALFMPLSWSQVWQPFCMSADLVVWKNRFPRKLKTISAHSTSCSAPSRLPCMPERSPNGSDQSSPNRGRSSASPGTGSSDSVCGSCCFCPRANFWYIFMFQYTFIWKGYSTSLELDSKETDYFKERAHAPKTQNPAAWVRMTLTPSSGIIVRRLHKTIFTGWEVIYCPAEVFN